jgi:sugar O-acyltransferase (sialic acid O-acetyltransferase NeuD family)
MKDLVVLGAGGSAGSIVELIGAINSVSLEWRLLGFLDDDPALAGTTLHGMQVLGPIDHAISMASSAFVIGVANYKRPSQRRDIAIRLNLPPERFATLIHPLASISNDSAIGRGVLIFPFAVVSDGASIGDHAFISQFCFVEHDSSVGDGAVMAPRSSLSGRSRLGADAFAGAHSVLRERISVGEGAVVGMGAVVVSDVGPGETVVGNPARPFVRREASRPG